MPRKARLDAPGQTHHVMNRGTDRRKIFNDPEDYRRFLDSLAELLAESKTKCYAWALMPNHFHLLLETGEDSLSSLMRRLLTGYAVYFNRKHNRVGHLFQNRFKSIVCDKNLYFKELVAYIHLNPLQAELVNSFSTLGAYRWCGHGALMGQQKAPWMAIDDVLEGFGANAAVARRTYLKFLSDRSDKKVAEGLLADLEDARSLDPRVRGDETFVETTLGLKERGRGGRSALTADDVVGRVAGALGLKPSDLSKPGKSPRAVAEARAMVAYALVRQLGEKAVDVARRFNISQPAVSVLFRRGAGLETRIREIVK